MRVGRTTKLKRKVKRRSKNVPKQAATPFVLPIDEYWEPKETKMTCEFIEKELAVQINEKKYYWQNPTRRYDRNDVKWNPTWKGYAGQGFDLPSEQSENHFRTGCRNIFLWSEGDDFGYKIFTRGENQKRRIYRTLFKERMRKLWFCNRATVETLHCAHNYLAHFNLAPKSYELINFNDGELWGLKVQRIIGENKWKDFESMRDAGFEESEYLDKLTGLMKKLDLNLMEGIDWNPTNYILCRKTNNIYFIDIEYKHLRFGFNRVRKRFNIK